MNELREMGAANTLKLAIDADGYLGLYRRIAR